MKAIFNSPHTFSKGISIGAQKTFQIAFKEAVQALVYGYLTNKSCGIQAHSFETIRGNKPGDFHLSC